MKDNIEIYKAIKPNYEKGTKINDGLNFCFSNTDKQLKTRPFLMSKRYRIIEQSFYEKFLIKKETYKMKILKTK